MYKGASNDEDLDFFLRELHQAKSEVLEVLTGSCFQEYQGSLALSAALLQGELNDVLLIKE